MQNPVVGENGVTTGDGRKSQCGWSRERRVSTVQGEAAGGAWGGGFLFGGPGVLLWSL